MTGSDEFQVPIANLQTIASSLKTVSSEIEAVENGVTSLAGVDDLTGHLLSAAVDEFFEEWKQSRKTLLKNVESLGEVSSGIADQTDVFDTNMASGLDEFTGELRGSVE